jgi:hypothetical protein
MPKQRKSDADLEVKGPASLYASVISKLRKEGYFLRVNLDSRLTSYHDLYQALNPSGQRKEDRLKGVTYPDWFEYLIPAPETSLITVQDEIRNPRCLGDMTPDEREFAEPLLIYRSTRSSEVTDYVLGAENHKALIHKKMGKGVYRLGIAYSPASIKDRFLAGKIDDIFAYVPERDWFDEPIRELKFEDIITIFPPAEAEMFKLLIGRACVGRTGSIHPGMSKPITHGFRKAGIIVGEPSIGKSTVLNGILNAMRYCGFDVANTGKFGNRFNQGSVVKSHLAYNDDLTLGALEDMLNADSFKSVVTGGTEKVENKGVDAIEVVSNTVIVANCNEIRSEISYSLDSGAISRLALISTYRGFEQEEMSETLGRDIHPVANIRHLCQKYDVDEIVLFMLVLRECTDFFLDKVNSSTDVHFYTEQLLPYLRIQIHKNALECFLRFCMLAYAIRDQKGQGNYLPELTLGSFATVLESTRFLMIDMKANNLRRNMKQHWEDSKRTQWHPYWAQRKMLISSVDKSYDTFITHKNDKDLTMALENVFSVLTLRDGFSMSKKSSHIVRTWEMVRGEKNKIYRMANELMSSISDPDEIKYITDKTNRCKSEWIYSPTYDPSSL